MVWRCRSDRSVQSAASEERECNDESMGCSCMSSVPTSLSPPIIAISSWRKDEEELINRANRNLGGCGIDIVEEPMLYCMSLLLTSYISWQKDMWLMLPMWAPAYPSRRKDELTRQTKSLPTATSELHALLGLPSLQSVPLLVLANKNDLPGAIGVDDLIKEMRLGEIGGRVVSVSLS